MSTLSAYSVTDSDGSAPGNTANRTLPLQRSRTLRTRLSLVFRHRALFLSPSDRALRLAIPLHLRTRTSAPSALHNAEFDTLKHAPVFRAPYGPELRPIDGARPISERSAAHLTYERQRSRRRHGRQLAAEPWRRRRGRLPGPEKGREQVYQLVVVQGLSLMSRHGQSRDRLVFTR